ncbi:DUF3379 family protein [Pseudohongiella spirulinae]|uniref:DUF3379 domain-containing protein n=1 Tax=Pseudohongiella spirulinae TaxID=1249552 RepID=A0A0S2KG36_9GAMM|nr:DUF3379 family protein [Pseudohongiella spirulinae]ALO47303.1 hypothetical protein PS2015_2671 [Pseudohongiella spirulinae]
MDDLEFRTRAFSNPLDDQADFISATETDAARRQLVHELKAMEHQLKESLNATPVPGDLREKLLAHANDTSQEGAAKHSSFRRLPYAAAATVVLGVFLGINLVQSRPSAQDLEFHDALVEHLYHEEPRYYSSTSPDWSDVMSVSAAAGAELTATPELMALKMQFANYCNLGTDQQGAHLVTIGEHGPVSIVFIKNTPVSKRITIKDSRFQGQIIPTEQGNMAVIGEKSEQLDRYEKLLTDNLHWSI